MSEQTTENQVTEAATQLNKIVKEKHVWFATLGGVLVVLGIAAIAFPYVTTIAAKVLLGYLILIGGVAHVIHAVMAKDWRGFLVNLLIGVLYVVAGAWLAFFPLTGVLVLTVFLAAVLVAEGILQIALGYRVRPEDGWMWIALSGVASIIVGALIWAELPSSAVWAIGLLVGIGLLCSGASFLYLGTVAGRK